MEEPRVLRSHQDQGSIQHVLPEFPCVPLGSVEDCWRKASLSISQHRFPREGVSRVAPDECRNKKYQSSPCRPVYTQLFQYPEIILGRLWTDMTLAVFDLLSDLGPLGEGPRNSIGNQIEE